MLLLWWWCNPGFGCSRGRLAQAAAKLVPPLQEAARLVLSAAATERDKAEAGEDNDDDGTTDKLDDADD